MYINCPLNLFYFYLRNISAASSISGLVIGGAGDGNDLAAKSDWQCRDGIATIGHRLGGYLVCVQYLYWFLPEALSNHADLLCYWVSKKLNVPVPHLQELHTSGMSPMRLELPLLILDNPQPKQPTEGNVDSRINQCSSISSPDNIWQRFLSGECTILNALWHASSVLLAPFWGQGINTRRIQSRISGVQLISFQILPLVGYSGKACWLPEKLIKRVWSDTQMTGTIVPPAVSWFSVFHHQSPVSISLYTWQLWEAAKCTSLKFYRTWDGTCTKWNSLEWPMSP